MIESFIIGILAGLGLGLKATGTYKNTKTSKVLFRIPIGGRKVFHFHHWSLSLLILLIIAVFIEAGMVSKQNSLILLSTGFFIAFGIQGMFLQGAFKFVEKKNSKR